MKGFSAARGIAEETNHGIETHDDDPVFKFRYRHCIGSGVRAREEAMQAMISSSSSTACRVQAGLWQRAKDTETFDLGATQ